MHVGVCVGECFHEVIILIFANSKIKTYMNAVRPFRNKFDETNELVPALFSYM